MMRLAAALVDVVRDMPSNVATALQDALGAQRWDDLHEVVWCPSCAGLGVVTDYTRPLESPAEVPSTPRAGLPDPVASIVYAGKVCGTCGGSGSR